MTVTLYHVPKTISSPIVQVLLELGVVDDPVMVEEMTFADLRSPKHLAINPMGTSPAFQDTDLDITMWESGAILDFVLENYDPQNMMYPAPTDERSSPEQIMARSKYLQLKQYIIATLYPFIASLYIHSLQPKENWDEAYMASAKKKCHTVLGPIMSNMLGEGPYFLGDQICALDFLAAKPLNNVRALGLLCEFPALEAHFDRVSRRSTFKQAYEGMKIDLSQQQQQLVMVPMSVATKPKKRRVWALRRGAATVSTTTKSPRDAATLLQM